MFVSPSSNTAKIPKEVDLAEIRAAFKQYGSIIEIIMPMSCYTGNHRGYAFVSFHYFEDANDAIEHPPRFKDAKLEVSFAKNTKKFSRGVFPVIHYEPYPSMPYPGNPFTLIFNQE